MVGQDGDHICEALVEGTFTTREAGSLKAGWKQGMAEARERLPADKYRALIAARTKAALGVKKAKGEKTGGSMPYGFSIALPIPHNFSLNTARGIS